MYICQLLLTVIFSMAKECDKQGLSFTNIDDLV